MSRNDQIRIRSLLFSISTHLYDYTGAKRRYKAILDIVHLLPHLFTDIWFYVLKRRITTPIHEQQKSSIADMIQHTAILLDYHCKCVSLLGKTMIADRCDNRQAVPERACRVFRIEEIYRTLNVVFAIECILRCF